MFKEKKNINENAIKKDFFKVKPKKEIFNLVLYSEIKHTKYFEIKKLKEIETLPKVGEEYKILTKQNNSSIDILEGRNIDELIVISSRIDIKSVKKISCIRNKHLIISSVINDRKPEIFVYCEENFKSVKSIKNHAKMLLFKIGENKYIIDTSANPSINARNEFYNIINDKKIYDEVRKCLKIKD